MYGKGGFYNRYGLLDASGELLVDSKLFDESDEFFSTLNNKAAKENSAARDALLQEQET